MPSRLAEKMTRDDVRRSIPALATPPAPQPPALEPCPVCGKHLVEPGMVCAACSAEVR